MRCLFIDSNTFNLKERKRKLYIRKQRKKFFRFIFFLLLGVILISLPFYNAIKEYHSPDAQFILTSTSPKNDKQFTVCIDPGHGDWDTGAIGISNSYEKDIVLGVALKLGDLLESNNIKVIYTRATDSIPWLETANDSLKERLQISKISNADLFISIHCNTTPTTPDTKGVETWYNPVNPESRYFASLLQTELSNLNYTYNRGLKTYIENEELAVLELNENIAALVELGFLSNFTDEKFLNSDIGQTKCAQALFDAIITYSNEL